ncbi:MAG TPA: ABC transporter ATP-binding protein [Chthoniobacteraceae bacterium]|nr:ABC transporter ATP-binding protein [Chthoniobacteraceae bacterium]
MAGKIILRDLVKRYGNVEAVRGVSLEVAEGEIFGLLGPNGAGKTSTLECIIGLRQPDGGSVSLCGIDAASGREAVKQRIGAVLQSTALQDQITPREALELFGAFYEKRADIGGLIARFSLGEKADARFESLSGGQKQRLALALAFVNSPEILFLDEPTAGLDPQSRRELHQSILKMREEGLTVLLTTHYIEEAHQLCDRIAIIDHGRIIASGKPEELIAQSKAVPRIALRTAQPVDLDALRRLPSVASAESGEGDGTRIKTQNIGRAVVEIAQFLDAAKNELLDMQVTRPSLEDVFIELTGSSLRD